MQPFLTILICTHNRAQLLGAALKSLDACRLPESVSAEILVVANACSDETHAVLEEWAARPIEAAGLPVRSLAEPRPGKSHALNRGFENLRGRWVAIVDDDHRVSEDFLLRIFDAITANPAASMLCGRILPDWDGREPAWVHDSGPYRVYPLPIPRQEFGENPRELTAQGPIPGGGNQIIRADVLQRVGPVSTELGPQGHDLGGGEDTEYMLRALRLGERLWYDPKILQYHHVDLQRLTLGYLMRKAYQRSSASVRLHASAEPVRSGGIPLFLFRKLAGYAIGALSSWGTRRRRFYLVRCAAALGEMAGYRALPRGVGHDTSRTRPTRPDSDHA